MKFWSSRSKSEPDETKPGALLKYLKDDIVGKQIPLESQTKIVEGSFEVLIEGPSNASWFLFGNQTDGTPIYTTGDLTLGDK